jgi:hypothetical protein
LIRTFEKITPYGTARNQWESLHFRGGSFNGIPGKSGLTKEVKKEIVPGPDAREIPT